MSGLLNKSLLAVVSAVPDGIEGMRFLFEPVKSERDGLLGTVTMSETKQTLSNSPEKLFWITKNIQRDQKCSDIQIIYL